VDIAPRTSSDEIYEFLTSSPTIEQIIAFKPTPQMQARVRYLLDVNRDGQLTDAERAELDEIERTGHLMRMLKAHAQLKLVNKQ